MGDASAVIGIIRRMGLVKVRQLSTSCGSKRKKHHVNYSTTEAVTATTALICSPRHLPQDSVMRHTEAMGCEYMFGKDPIAFTVNNLCANVSLET